MPAPQTENTCCRMETRDRSGRTASFSPKASAAMCSGIARSKPAASLPCPLKTSGSVSSQQPHPTPSPGVTGSTEEGTEESSSCPQQTRPLQLTCPNCSKKRLDDAPTRAAATALPGQAAVGTGRRGAWPGARAAAHSPGMGDEVVHGDLHRLALGDLSEGFEDELVVKGI